MSRHNHITFDYLDAARNFEDAARQLFDRSDLRAPALHLIAHGFELTFKSVLLHFGRTEQELRQRPFGHDLWYMWNERELEFLRQYLPVITESVTDNATASKLYQHPQAFSAVEPCALFRDQIQLLSKLHSHASAYALRYPPANNPSAPLVPFLGDVLGCLIDDVRDHLLSRPS